jgi:hypothetical protein
MAAIDQATEDGTIEYWSWHQLLGQIPPPTTEEIEALGPPEQWKYKDSATRQFRRAGI